MKGQQQQAVGEYKKKRQQFSVKIRQSNRQQKFNKRRNLVSNPLNGDQQDNQGDNKNQYDRQIIDMNHYDKIVQICNTQFQQQQLPQLIQYVKCDDILNKHVGIIGIRKLLALEVDPPIQQVIDAGMIPKFIELARQNQFPQLKLESVWCMTNIASGTNEHCKALADKGALDLFVNVLNQNQKGVVDQAIWAIGNLAADRVSYRDKIIELNGLAYLINIVESSGSTTIIKNGAWSLTNLCRGLPLPNYNKIKIAVPVLCKVIKSKLVKDKQILSDCCWALSYMSEGSKSRAQKVLEEGIIDQLFLLAYSEYSLLCTPALRVLGNFSTGNQLQAQQLIKYGIFKLAIKIVSGVKKTMRRQMCWLLSNLAVGTPSQVQAFIANQQLIIKLLQLFQNDSLQVRKQICWIFANMGHHGHRPSVIMLFQQHQIMKYYVSMLNEQDQDALQNSLESLQKILIYGDKSRVNGTNILLKLFQNAGGSQKLEALQFNQSNQVYTIVIRIIQRFFSVQEDNFQFGINN